MEHFNPIRATLACGCMVMVAAGGTVRLVQCGKEHCHYEEHPHTHSEIKHNWLVGYSSVAALNASTSAMPTSRVRGLGDVFNDHWGEY
jgi:hypothetical protein